MGIVKRQAFFNTVFNYTGQIIGYANIALFFPLVLTQQEFGLTRIITSLATVFAQASSFGVQRVTIRFFPAFRTEDKRHEGFLFLLLFMAGLGFVLCTAVFLLFRDEIIALQADSDFFSLYYLAVPFTALFILYGWLFDNFLGALFKTNLTSFLNNVLIKLLWTASGFVYWQGWIDFDQFVAFYFGCYGFTSLVSLGYLAWIGHFRFQISITHWKKRMLKPIFNYGVYSVFDNGNAILMNHLDKIMIGMMMDYESVAVYAVGSYLATIIYAPCNSMSRILAPMINRFWKARDAVKVFELYRQSALLFTMLAGSALVLIWGNIHDLMQFIAADYRSGIYVVLFIMLAQLSEALFGMNSDVILASRYYRFNTISAAILVALMIVFNLFLIPIYGYTGAALGTFLSKLAHNVIKYVFIYSKFDFQPFTFRNAKAVAVLIASMLVSYVIPTDSLHFAIAVAIKGCLLSALMLSGYYFWNVSAELNEVIDKHLKKYGIRFF